MLTSDAIFDVGDQPHISGHRLDSGIVSLTSGYLSREQLVRVLNLTSSKVKLSNAPFMLSKWLPALAKVTAALNATIADESLNICECVCLVFVFCSGV